MSRKALTAVLFGSLLLLVISVLGVAQPDGEPLPIFKTAFFAGTGNCAGCQPPGGRGKAGYFRLAFVDHGQWRETRSGWPKQNQKFCAQQLPGTH